MRRPTACLDTSRLCAVAERAYAAALQPELWRQLFQDLAEAAAAEGVIGFHFGQHDPGSFLCSPSLDGSLDAYLRDAWHERNPRIRNAAKLSANGRLISDIDLVDSMQDEEGRSFSNDFLRRNGLGWFAGTDLYADQTNWLAISIERNHRLEPFQAAELEVLQRTMAHVTRALSIAPALDDAAARGLIAGLDEVGRAAALLDRTGRILVVSRAAETLLRDRVVLARDGCLHLADKLADRRLQAFVASLVRAGVESEREVATSVVSRHTDGRPLIVRGAPIAASGAEIFKRAKAYVTLELVGAPPRPSEVLLREAYGLTPAEARVAQAIAQGREVAEIAVGFDISVETVRTHLRAVYGKTGMRRQAALAVLLSSVPAAD